MEGKRYLVWPMFMQEDGQWTIPDPMLFKVWEQLYLEGKARDVFYGGTVSNELEFIGFMKSGGIYPALVIDSMEQKIVFLAWLSDFKEEGYAFGHFCSLGSYKRGAGKAILEYWEKFAIWSVIGITPESNVKALKMVKTLGFHTLSESIPKMCAFWDGRLEAARISYFDFGKTASL